MPIWTGGMAILVLGWSDGLAALIGQKTKWGEFKIYAHTKSAAGIVTMFISSLIVSTVFLLLYSGKAFFPTLAMSAEIAGAVTIVELFTPFGMDNLTVPATVAIMASLIH